MGWCIVVGLLLPTLVAIWTIPGFVTQDGPAHLYNAWILARSFDPASPYRAYYEVRWQLLPNWAGHLVLAALVRLVPPWTADRIMMTTTLLGFPLALVWLRWKIQGDRGLAGACLLAVILALNFLWLMGFASFLLGCCVLPITLGFWWSHRDRLTLWPMGGLAALMVLGYACHLVSLGLTVIGLATLALFAPPQSPAQDCWRHRLRRAGRTALGCSPLMVLGIVYLRLSRAGGPMHPRLGDSGQSVLALGVGGTTGLG